VTRNRIRYERDFELVIEKGKNVSIIVTLATSSHVHRDKKNKLNDEETK
jgi:hypothetical protein